MKRLPVSSQKKLILNAAKGVLARALQFPHTREEGAAELVGLRTAVLYVWNDTCELYQQLNDILKQLHDAPAKTPEGAHV